MALNEKQIWVINKSENPVEICILELKRFIKFEPRRPQRLPFQLALQYTQSYNSLEICADPERYFKDQKFKQLIIRDAGIGDLLLLEPVIRTLHENGREISVLNMFPAVYDNHPLIKENIRLDIKENIGVVDTNKYDIWEDLRNYSETSDNRDRSHRTDIYNEKFDLKIDDKEPRLYFKNNEKYDLKKKKGYIYIGIECDASHSYRKYPKGRDLVNYLLKKNKKFVIVLMGDKNYIKVNKNKRVVNLQKKTTIREAINVIKELDYMIAVDSGLMHIALTMHIPTACIFSIITPDFRIRYYTGECKVIWKDLQCKGCGDRHMMECRHGDVKVNPEFVPPCLNISPEYICDELLQMSRNIKPRLFYNGNKNNKNNGNGKKNIVEKEINIIAKPVEKTLTLPIIVLNEEKNLPRFIENVINNKYIGKVIAIDGGSNDKTVKLLENAGAYVYTHIYDKTYHDAQAMQRNYSCSFVRDGEKIIIVDIDECFSKELRDYLPVLAEMDKEYGIISRRTFNYYKDIDDPTRQIKDYPDYQPRFFTWNRRFKWVGSPHHQIYNAPEPVKIQKDIIHFEKENKDRDDLEKQWSEMDKATKEIYA